MNGPPLSKAALRARPRRTRRASTAKLRRRQRNRTALVAPPKHSTSTPPGSLDGDEIVSFRQLSWRPARHRGDSTSQERISAVSTTFESSPTPAGSATPSAALAAWR